MGSRYIPPGKKSLKKSHEVASTEVEQSAEQVVAEVASVVAETMPVLEAAVEAVTQIQEEPNPAAETPIAEAQALESSATASGAGFKRKK